jgi:pimeloyl-ACP methyl ester carboxylesterase
MRFERDETSLSVDDFGGTGPPMLLLHGLAGYGGEWRDSADLLTDSYRVFALDQRGHGNSQRRPLDTSREAYVEDAAAAIGKLGLGPVTLVGQSMGANTAMLVAADHPELVTALVVIEGSPDGPDDPQLGVQAAEQIGKSLRRWPVPFADRDAARTFFVEKGFDAETWADGLERRPDGLWPRFEVDALVACMADLQSRAYWEQWRQVRCPTLLVFGEHGMFDTEHEQRVADALPGCSLVRVPSAGHDVHLDAPASWVEALEELTAPTDHR